MTNSLYSFSQVAALRCSFSDHPIVVGDYFGRSHDQSGHRTIQVCCYRKFDVTVLEYVLTDDVWNKVFTFGSVNDSAECFVTVLQAILDLLLLLHHIRVKQHINHWETSNTARRQRDKLYR